MLAFVELHFYPMSTNKKADRNSGLFFCFVFLAELSQRSRRARGRSEAADGLFRGFACEMRRV